MRPRALRNLAQLDDEAFFAEVASGLWLISSHVDRLLDAALIAPRQPRHPVAASILLQLAKEEAAKCQILIDAVRCPRQPSDLSRQLGYFYQHFARCLYADVYDWKPADFVEVERGIESERESHFVGGPNEEWINRNDIETKREELLYVDYVERDGHCEWVTPESYDLTLDPFSMVEPRIFKVVSALQALGFFSPIGLRLIAEVWRPLKLSPQTAWAEIEKLNAHTIERAVGQGIARKDDIESCSRIIEDWTFPLYGFDLTIHVQER